MAVVARPGTRSSRSVELVIDLSQREIDDILSDLQEIPGAMQSAAYSAVVRTAKTAKTRVSSLIRKQTTLKKTPVDRRLQLKRFPAKNSTDPSAELVVSGRKISLYLFAGKPVEPPSQRGMSVNKRGAKNRAGWKVWKGEKLARHKLHFVQRSKKGKGPYIMVRTPMGKGGRAAKSPADYRIKYGPSLVEIMERRGLFKNAQIELTEVLRKNLESQVQRFLAIDANRKFKKVLVTVQKAEAGRFSEVLNRADNAN